MFDEFLKLTKTTDEVQALQNEADMLLQALYEGHAENLGNFIRENVRANFAQIFTSLLSDGGEREGSLKSLKEMLTSLETFKLTLAFQPSQGFIDRIYEFVSQSAGNKFVFEIICQPNLIGGAIITYKGEYRDFSLNRFYSEEFSANRKKILKMLMYGEKMVDS
jgi:F0F1-type ATP synthase delta subunit